MKEYFCVSADKYVKGKEYKIVRPASLDNPKDNSVMFIMESRIEKASVFNSIKECLIFWPKGYNLPAEIESRHAVVICSSTRNAYCSFFIDNGITYLPQKEEFNFIDGAFVSKDAHLGENVVIMPGSYVSGNSVIGDNVYIGTGVKIVGDVVIGNNVIIRENTVIGADGLSTDRDSEGKALTMPQFGRVVIDDDVQIGANTVIARGAIDDTRIYRGAKIDSQCFISHNTSIGEDSFIVGETILFGSSSVGKRCLISGNCTIANFVSIGDDSILGMSATALKSVPSNVIAYGSPVKSYKDR